jgi:signal transduction histidine kinase
VDAEDGAPRLRVRVRDDGPGADPASVRSSEGLGLSLVRRRLELLCGRDAELSVETAPGRGFEARIEMPLDGTELERARPPGGRTP